MVGVFATTLTASAAKERCDIVTERGRRYCQVRLSVTILARLTSAENRYRDDPRSWEGFALEMWIYRFGTNPGPVVSAICKASYKGMISHHLVFVDRIDRSSSLTRRSGCFAALPYPPVRP
jgi:hypothetical protein